LPGSPTMIGQVQVVSKGGQGIVFHEGRPVFLAGVIPGERVEFTVTGQKGAVGFGSLARIIEPSPQRRVPPCPHYERCGGCNFQHIAAAEQVVLKQAILIDNLKRLAHVSLPFVPPVLPSPAFRYRTRSSLKIKDHKIGFYERQSHQVVEIETCLLLPPAAENFLSKLRQDPLIRDIDQGEVLLLCNGPEVSALAIDHRGDLYLTPARDLAFRVGSFVFHYAPKNFIQANLFTLQTMIDLVADALGEFRPKTAVDLFCGSGFFTLPLARLAGKVVALEIDSGNIKALRRNLATNRVENVDIMAADIMKAPIPEADVYLVDPPRAGLTRRLVAKIIAHRPAAILYFSCDSATFCRDLSYFQAAGYKIADLKIIDNFPQTDHFEIFCFLQL